MILEQLGVTVTPYKDMIHPQEKDQRDPMTIAIERAEKMGIKVVKR